MKGDFSRRTFDRSKHYESVQMQQGRVQLDADWNEQSDLIGYRIETETEDVVGAHGAPLHAAGFEITPAVAKDFEIGGPGRYYVDGLLCENESVVAYSGQPDWLEAPALPDTGRYLVYLEVWERHVTALDDPLLRETALGGPDTATRVKTIWQVKWQAVESGANCCSAFTDFLSKRPDRSGTMKARAAAEAAGPDPCLFAPSAGYRGLENQLYRVEVHHAGHAYEIPAGDTDAHVVTAMSGTPLDTITVQDGTWSVGDWVEIICTTAPGGGTTKVDPMAGSLARVIGLNGLELTLDQVLPNLMDQTPKVRRVRPQGGATCATLKWSRDNGTVVTSITKIAGTEISVHDLGPDDVLGFAAGQWVEISDDRLELSGTPGQLAQIVDTRVDPEGPVVIVKAPVEALAAGDDGVNADRHPKLRRWDGIAAVKRYPSAAEKDWLHLEAGVQVQCSTGGYLTGDYWLIPARTVTANAEAGGIEWPGGTSNPTALPPAGIEHHYAPLALLDGTGPNGAPAPVSDCRRLFAPLTELATFEYVSGDGQEVMPGAALPRPLQVGVFRGRWPVPNARVLFATNEGGALAASTGFGSAPAPVGVTDGLIVITNADGIASCEWTPKAALNDPATWTNTPQQVEARLLNANDARQAPYVRFTANLSVAEKVAYHPGDCRTLSSAHDVQAALETLAGLARIQYVSGDGQDAQPPSLALPLPVQVAVVSDCGPLTGQDVQVTFSVEGGAHVAPSAAELPNGGTSLTRSPGDASGTVECYWQLNPNGASAQRLTATLSDAAGHPVGAPATIFFTGNRGVAAAESCCLVVDPEHAHDLPEIILKGLREKGGLCICLKPGRYELPEGLMAATEASAPGSPRVPWLRISGCGEATQLVARRNSVLRGLGSVTLHSLAFQLGDDQEFGGEGIGLLFDKCREVVIDECHLAGGRASLEKTRCLCGVGGAERVEVRSSSFAMDGNLPVFALLDGDAEAHLEDNTFEGPLSLYGVSGGEPLSQDDVAKLRAHPQLKFTAAFTYFPPPRIVFGAGGGVLHARGNTIAAIRIDEGLAKQIKGFTPQSADFAPPSTYECGFLANNTIERQSELLMRETSLSANALRADAAVIAHSAVYVGNHAPPAGLAHFSEGGLLLWRGSAFRLPSSLAVETKSGSCWIADFSAHCVVRIDANGREMWRVDQFSAPGSVAAGPDGSCWVVDRAASRVAHLDPNGKELKLQDITFNVPIAVSVFPEDGSCWVLEQAGNKVTRFASNGAVMWQSAVDLQSPVALSVSPTDGSAWVADSARGEVIHLAANNGTRIGSVGGLGHPFAISAGEDRCWVADPNNNRVVLLTVTGTTITAGQPITVEHPTSVSASPKGDSCWVGCGVTAPVPVAVRLSDDSCWVADANSGQLARVANGQILWQGQATGVTLFSSTQSEEACANLHLTIKAI